MYNNMRALNVIQNLSLVLIIKSNDQDDRIRWNRIESSALAFAVKVSKLSSGFHWFYNYFGPEVIVNLVSLSRFVFAPVNPWDALRGSVLYFTDRTSTVKLK